MFWSNLLVDLNLLFPLSSSILTSYAIGRIYVLAFSLLDGFLNLTYYVIFLLNNILFTLLDTLLIRNILPFTLALIIGFLSVLR